MSIFKDNFLHEIPDDIQKYIIELFQCYVLDDLLMELDIRMTQYIDTRYILNKKLEDEENDPDYGWPVIDWRPTIDSQLQSIGVYEKGEEINKFLKDYKDKYGKNDAYKLMNKKINKRYKFFQKYICNL